MTFLPKGCPRLACVELLLKFCTKLQEENSLRTWSKLKLVKVRKQFLVQSVSFFSECPLDIFIQSTGLLPHVYILGQIIPNLFYIFGGILLQICARWNDSFGQNLMGWVLIFHPKSSLKGYIRAKRKSSNHKQKWFTAQANSKHKKVKIANTIHIGIFPSQSFTTYQKHS